MPGPDPWKRIQDEVDQLDQEIQDLIDLLPDIPVKQRPGVLRRIALLRRQEHNFQVQLSACHRDPSPFALQLDGIEVVQAIQSLDNSVPLVAGKTTVPRVYLSYYGNPGITVRGTLRVQSTWTPLALVPSQADTALDPAQAGDTAAKRKNAALSLNLVFPADAITRASSPRPSTRSPMSLLGSP